MDLTHIKNGDVCAVKCTNGLSFTGEVRKHGSDSEPNLVINNGRGDIHTVSNDRIQSIQVLRSKDD